MRATAILTLLVLVGSSAACDAGTAGLAPVEPTFVRGGGANAELNVQLAALRRATAQFHNFERAKELGYDTEITTCWYHPSEGAQGYHYGRLDRILDPTVELLEPELLMFEPGPGGQYRLVGIEYIVPIDLWQGSSPPRLLQQDYHRNDELGIYALHVWLWRDNPSGLFADWNPKVSCEHADESVDRSH